MRTRIHQTSTYCTNSAGLTSSPRNCCFHRTPCDREMTCWSGGNLSICFANGGFCTFLTCKTCSECSLSILYELTSPICSLQKGQWRNVLFIPQHQPEIFHMEYLYNKNLPTRYTIVQTRSTSSYISKNPLKHLCTQCRVNN